MGVRLSITRLMPSRPFRRDLGRLVSGQPSGRRELGDSINREVRQAWNGQRLVVRNGHLPKREVVSGVGPIPVRQPRVRHRDKGRFSSAILPKYMRRGGKGVAGGKRGVASIQKTKETSILPND